MAIWCVEPPWREGECPIDHTTHIAMIVQLVSVTIEDSKKYSLSAKMAVANQKTHSTGRNCDRRRKKGLLKLLWLIMIFERLRRIKLNRMTAINQFRERHLVDIFKNCLVTRRAAFYAIRFHSAQSLMRKTFQPVSFDDEKAKYCTRRKKEKNRVPPCIQFAITHSLQDYSIVRTAWNQPDKKSNTIKRQPSKHS